MNPITTRSRKLEQFFFLHGIDFISCTKDDDGMTVWTYERTTETEHILNEFHLAQNRRDKKGA
jgi:hypothetical protein